MAYDVSGAERYLEDAARARRLVTYGELAEKFGGSPQGWLGPLNRLAIRMRADGWPLLSVCRSERQGCSQRRHISRLWDDGRPEFAR